MRLLVSVRSAAEVPAALEGGGDIVDAKEPLHGPLGPVSAGVLQAIAAVVPPDVPLSAALGDVASAAEAVAAVNAVPRLPGRTAVYLKLGFAGVEDEGSIAAILGAAVAAAHTRGDRAAVVGVAYADHRRARTPPPPTVTAAAARGGAAGVLVDTWGKDGRDLLEWMPRRELRAWVAAARAGGLLTAVAGGLEGPRLAEAAATGADVLGVRGAVCEGGREGLVRALLVRRVRLGLAGGPRLDRSTHVVTLK